MKKIILAVLIVMTFAGMAYAIDYDQAATNELAAQWKGRSVTSDASVVLNVWYTGSGYASYGVSADHVIYLYDDGTDNAIDPATYDTMDEVVSYINSITNFKASLGADARASSPSVSTIAKANAALGNSEEVCGTVAADNSTLTYLAAGIKANPGALPRLKSITSSLASSGGSMTITVYDGDTAVWTKWVDATQWGSATSVNASSSSIVFTTGPEKGLSGTKGNNLLVTVDTDGSFDTSASAKNGNRIAIMYDELKQ